MEEKFVINRKDFKKLERYAENIYNTAVVIDYFVANQPEIEECYNLAPVVKHLRNDADVLNAFFILRCDGLSDPQAAVYVPGQAVRLSQRA